MAVHKVSSKGQVTLPVECRRALGIQAHDRVFIGVEGEKIIIRPVPDFMELEGCLGKRLFAEEEERAQRAGATRRGEEER